MSKPEATYRPYPPFGLLQIKLTDASNPVQSPFDGSPAEHIIVNVEKIATNVLDFYATDLESFQVRFFPKGKFNHPFRLGDYGSNVDQEINCFMSQEFIISGTPAQRLQVVANQGSRKDPPSITYKIYPQPKPGTAIPDQIIDPDCCMEC